jgi:hypothetical protein
LIRDLTHLRKAYGEIIREENAPELSHWENVINEAIERIERPVLHKWTADGTITGKEEPS